MTLKHPAHHGKKQFFGTTTVGEKGQVVIPAEAREALKLSKGEKLLVFGMGDQMIAFSKLEHLEEFASHLAEKLESIQTILKRNRKK